MHIKTIRIASEASNDNSEGFIIINLVDFDSSKHEPFDDEARAALAGADASGEYVPRAAELLAASDDLLQRHADAAANLEGQFAALDQRRADLDARDADLKVRAAAQEAEVQRLSAEAAKQTEAAPTKGKPSKPE
ncbi:hypothetical protein [Massilia antarctica]|uniref:hypothetical protein n=1 Tax=Massilia antarctica TaxID=2765360 RepID=UPI0022707F9F|nr:hypothetical protein [Massilia sp. H27-R4]MCY0910843.1 hypothetical protein [Massilia sp. H27-R4]